MSTNFKNWSTAVQFTPAQIQYPGSEEELAALLKKCAANKWTPRVVGAGHSFTPLVSTNGVLISLDKLSGLIAADKENLTAEVFAGTRLKELGQILYAEGMAMENLGDIDVQSVAGAVSTGTHGTGINFGTIATQIIGLTLVTAKGDIISCSETENREIFKAAQISLGVIGIITRIKLRLLPSYKLKYISAKAKLDDVLAKLEDYKQNTRNFEFYWFPFTQTVQTKEMNITDEAPKKGGLGKWFNDIFLENGVFWILSKISRFIPGTSKTVSKIAAWGVSAGTNISWSHEVFATPRLVRFQEMEYNIPQENFSKAIKEIEKTIAERNFRVHFPIECRWVKADDIPLSPAYGRDSAYIAVHMYKGMPYKEYFEAMETILKKYGGRPHWGKMHTQTAVALSKSYPKWDEFHQVRKQLDPEGLFLNDYLKELFGED